MGLTKDESYTINCTDRFRGGDVSNAVMNHVELYFDTKNGFSTEFHGLTSRIVVGV